MKTNPSAESTPTVLPNLSIFNLETPPSLDSKVPHTYHFNLHNSLLSQDYVKMFRRLESGLPKDPVFPKDLKGLG
jgi:hypothetical protein